MRPTYTRRYRRSRNTKTTDDTFFKKEGMENSFFHNHQPQPFFTNTTAEVSRKTGKEEEKKEQIILEQTKMKMAKKPEMKEEMKEEKLAKKEALIAQSTTKTKAIANPIPSGGNALPQSLNEDIGGKMGVDLSGTVLHNSEQAHEMADQFNAKAYAYKNHIVFGKGQFKPETEEGKRLLAHELAHIAQQRGGGRQVQREGIEVDEKLSKKEAEATVKTTDPCSSLSLEGKTSVDFSGSTWSVIGEKTKKTKSCDACGGSECTMTTGTLVSNFIAKTTVFLPTIPPGLSACERAIVKNAINTVLKAHENEHVVAYKTYNGTVKTPFSHADCDGDIYSKLNKIHADLDIPRQDAARAASNALDPFKHIVNCNCSSKK